MTDRTRTGLEIIGAAAVLGVSGNLLLRETPWGLNAFVFVALFVTALVVLMYRHRPELLTKTNIALSGAMIFFASMFLIRDAEELLVWDTLAIIVLMGVMLLANFDLKAHISGAFHYVASVLWAGITSAFGSFMLLGSDIDWSSMPAGKASKNAFAALRGIAIAAPLVFIFGALFMAADAAFEGLVNRTFNFDFDKVVSHVMITSVLAWLTAGYLRGSLIKPFAPAAAGASITPDVSSSGVSSPHVSKGSSSPTSDADAPQAETRPVGSVPLDASTSESDHTSSFVAKVAEEHGESGATLPNNASILEHINISDPPNAEVRTGSDSDRVSSATEPASNTTQQATNHDWQNLDSSNVSPFFTLGTVETVLIFGLVNLLFLAFVIVQIPYLFGGMELVQNTPDFKLAEYARRGFGELVAVAALVLPMLLLSHWLLRKDGSRVGAIYKVFAGIQIALLFVIMASAAQRLLLLTGELGYGLTTVRFYPAVVMTWLAVVFIWFAATVLRGQRNYFAWGALWSAIVILGATNLMNPHAFIVRTNLELMQQGREFDGDYNGHLSDDSIPVLFNGLERMSLEDRCQVMSAIHYRYRQLGKITDLRSLSFPRRHAYELLRTNDRILHQTDGCAPQYSNDQGPHDHENRL